MINNFFKSKYLIIYAAILMVFTGLYACGAGVNTTTAGGGIGGTGKSVGTVTAFGSVFVNSVEYETTGVPIKVNGVIINESALEVGMKVEVISQNGKATAITYESEITGPVESNFELATNSFTVLGQTITVDVNTVYIGVNSAADLIANSNNVEVSGFFDASGNIRATYVELKADSLQDFRIKGTVSQIVSSTSFQIGSLTIDYSNVQNPPAIAAGLFVHAEGTKPAGILVATDLNVEDELPEGSEGDEVEFQGIVSNVISQSDFEVNGQRVLTNAQTLYEYGNSSNIIDNVLVEVDGTIDSNGNLVAQKIEFRFIETSEMEIKGRVDTGSVNTADSTVSILGQTIHITAATIMKDESSAHVQSFSLNNVNDGDLLEIDGFLNNEGDFIASKLKREDNS